jgi:hypothetical protein
MGAYAHQQNVLTDDADHLPPLSNKKSRTNTVSRFPYAGREAENRVRRMPTEEK